MLVDVCMCVCVKKGGGGGARISRAPFPRPPGNEVLGVQKGYFDLCAVPTASGRAGGFVGIPVPGLFRRDRPKVYPSESCLDRGRIAHHLPRKLERHWNVRAGKTGVPRENPPASSIVQHDSHTHSKRNSMKTMERLHSHVQTRASDVCSLAAAPESSLLLHAWQYGTRYLFPFKSAIGSESPRACLTNCNPIAKSTSVYTWLPRLERQTESGRGLPRLERQTESGRGWLFIKEPSPAYTMSGYVKPYTDVVLHARFYTTALPLLGGRYNRPGTICRIWGTEERGKGSIGTRITHSIASKPKVPAKFALLIKDKLISKTPEPVVEWPIYFEEIEQIRDFDYSEASNDTTNCGHLFIRQWSLSCHRKKTRILQYLRIPCNNTHDGTNGNNFYWFMAMAGTNNKMLVCQQQSIAFDRKKAQFVLMLVSDLVQQQPRFCLSCNTSFVNEYTRDNMLREIPGGHLGIADLCLSTQGNCRTAEDVDHLGGQRLAGGGGRAPRRMCGHTSACMSPHSYSPLSLSCPLGTSTSNHLSVLTLTLSLSLVLSHPPVFISPNHTSSSTLQRLAVRRPPEHSCNSVLTYRQSVSTTDLAPVSRVPGRQCVAVSTLRPRVHLTVVVFVEDVTSLEVETTMSSPAFPCMIDTDQVLHPHQLPLSPHVIVHTGILLKGTNACTLNHHRGIAGSIPSTAGFKHETFYSHVSPQDIRLFPKAPERKEIAPKRKTRKSAILTDTPVKVALAAEKGPGLPYSCTTSEPFEIQLANIITRAYTITSISDLHSCTEADRNDWSCLSVYDRYRPSTASPPPPPLVNILTGILLKGNNACALNQPRGIAEDLQFASTYYRRELTGSSDRPAFPYTQYITYYMFSRRQSFVGGKQGPTAKKAKCVPCMHTAGSVRMKTKFIVYECKEANLMASSRNIANWHDMKVICAATVRRPFLQQPAADNMKPVVYRIQAVLCLHVNSVNHSLPDMGRCKQCGIAVWKRHYAGVKVDITCSASGVQDSPLCLPEVITYPFVRDALVPYRRRRRGAGRLNGRHPQLFDNCTRPSLMKTTNIHQEDGYVHRSEQMVAAEILCEGSFVPLETSPSTTLTAIMLKKAQHDKIDCKRVNTEVILAIGSEFIRHALDDSTPIANLQRNTKRITYCQTWDNTGATANKQTFEVRLYKGLRSLANRAHHRPIGPYYTGDYPVHYSVHYWQVINQWRAELVLTQSHATSPYFHSKARFTSSRFIILPRADGSLFREPLLTFAGVISSRDSAPRQTTPLCVPALSLKTTYRHTYSALLLFLSGSHTYHAYVHTTCIQVDLKLGFQKFTFYREEPISPTTKFRGTFEPYGASGMERFERLLTSRPWEPIRAKKLAYQRHRIPTCEHPWRGKGGGDPAGNRTRDKEKLLYSAGVLANGTRRTRPARTECSNRNTPSHQYLVVKAIHDKMAMLILHKEDEYTTSMPADLKQGFQKCSFYREQPTGVLLISGQRVNHYVDGDEGSLTAVRIQLRWRAGVARPSLAITSGAIAVMNGGGRVGLLFASTVTRRRYLACENKTSWAVPERRPQPRDDSTRTATVQGRFMGIRGPGNTQFRRELMSGFNTSRTLGITFHSTPKWQRIRLFHSARS
ncbi:hypothetical protein PR048_021908 [Dryococelus australis]|uniref:Uncharacterized protein n=1 Tax=Dryococelus australis TaxID=614101 RepID=A0ABQ9GZJ5_9NEOP|nr:hypothetical protein PR048_021908 [Dryococelus australis]